MGEEYPYTDTILPLSAVFFFLVWVLDSFAVKFSVGYTSFVPDAARIVLFVALEISAALLAYFSHNALFGEKQKECKLITDGVFGYVRHPLYLGILLIYLGFIFGSMSIISIVPLVCYIFLFDRMATYEEEALVRIYGDTYLEYKKKVPKWIPNLLSSKTKSSKLASGNEKNTLPLIPSTSSIDRS
jgi:protein-S-isoprenylcysteine O-methyltransferase Ste14